MNRIVQAQYGRSTEHSVHEDISLLVKPVSVVNKAIVDVRSALVARDIDGMCLSIRALLETLHLQSVGGDAGAQYANLERYIRTESAASVESCVAALQNACLNRPESDISIQSTDSEITLPHGTHFIDAMNHKRTEGKKMIVFHTSDGESSVNTQNKALRARVVVGPGENVRVTSSNTRLVIFSILHSPQYGSVKTQIGDPAYARYLDGSKDTFMAGRHFPAEILGDPSWHELKLSPHSSQVGFEHVHPHIRLVYVTQGNGTLETGVTADCFDQAFDLQPGKLVILTPGSWHRFSTSTAGLTVQPVHPVTPTSGASANSHEMFFGTWSDPADMLKTIHRGAAR